MPQDTLTPDARRTVLDQRIARYVRKGWVVQSVSDTQAVLTRNKRIGLWLNLLLVVCTGGVWLIYVIYRALNRKRKTLVISVDAYGRVSER